MSTTPQQSSNNRKKLGMFLALGPVTTIFLLYIILWVASYLAPSGKALIDTAGPYFAIVVLSWFAISAIFFLSFISIPMGIILIIRSKRATN